MKKGSVVNLTCSWNLHAGQDAAIEARFHGSKGGIAMTNVSGSFVNFRADRFRGTARDCLCEPPDEWGGRAAVTWARQLASGSLYDPAIEQIVKVTSVLDEIYARAGDHWR